MHSGCWNFRAGTPHSSVWLASAEERLRAALAELGERGTTVDTHMSRLRTDPWDFVVGAEAPGGTS